MTQQFIKHTASAGETWDIIAFKYYTAERMASVIIKANPRYIETTVFEGGEILQIPVVDDIETSETLPPWRR